MHFIRCTNSEYWALFLWVFLHIILFHSTFVSFPICLLRIFHFRISPNTEQSLHVSPGIKDHCSQQVLSYCLLSGRYPPMKFTLLDLQCICGGLLFLGRGCLLWPVRSLGKTLLAFALLHSVLEGQSCLLLQVFLDFLLLHSSPL